MDTMGEGNTSRTAATNESLPTVVGEGLKVLLDGEPVWLSCLPANLREVLRGLENGMFGPPVPVGTRGDGAQRWANAALHLSTVSDAIRAVEALNRALLATVAKDREAGASGSDSLVSDGETINESSNQ